MPAALKQVSVISRAGPKSLRSLRSTTSSGSMTADTLAADMRGLLLVFLEQGHQRTAPVDVVERAEMMLRGT